MKSEWYTPDALYYAIRRRYGPFTLDPCCTPETARAPKFYTVKEDGLAQPWSGRVFCNPPYGREIAKWIRKAVEEQARGVTTVMLLPASTDTAWFHDYCLGRPIEFLRGRVCFSGSGRAPFASMIVVFGSEL